jgi:quercetin dioxygenase-like cupin family protein
LNLNLHAECTAATPFPGVTRTITMDRSGGAGGISTGLVTIEPGGAIRPHTHLVEEAMTVLEGDVLVLVGDERREVRGGGFTVLAPANVPHGFRNIGATIVRIVIAYPSVEVTATAAQVDL